MQKPFNDDELENYEDFLRRICSVSQFARKQKFRGKD